MPAEVGEQRMEEHCLFAVSYPSLWSGVSLAETSHSLCEATAALNTPLRTSRQKLCVCCWAAINRQPGGVSETCGCGTKGHGLVM